MRSLAQQQQQRTSSNVAVRKSANTGCAPRPAVLAPRSVVVEYVSLRPCNAPALAGGRIIPTRGARLVASAKSTSSSAPKQPPVEHKLELASQQVTPTLKRVSITVPAGMVLECYKITVEKLKQIVGKLPGFRTDKIPLSMLVTQAGGQRTFKLTVIEEILSKVVPMAIEQSGSGDLLVPESERIASHINDLEAAFDPAKSLVIDIEYEMMKPLAWKRSYKEAAVSVRDTGNFTTDSNAVDDLIRQYLKKKGFQRVVAGRGMQAQDTCIFDVEVCSVGSTTPLPGLLRKKANLDTEQDPLGLFGGMAGMCVGDERTFEITFPEDYHVELWRGMKATAKAKLIELFYWVTPEFNDDFVKAHKEFSEKFDSAEDMRKQLLAATAMTRVEEFDRQMEDSLWDEVVACVDVPEVPPSLVARMGNLQYRNNLMSMVQNGMATPDDVDQLITEQLIEEYIEKNTKDLEDMVKFNLAIDAIYEAESLTIDESSIQAEVDTQCEQYKAQDMEFDAETLRENMIDQFKNVAVIEWLKDNCKKTVIPFDAPAPGKAAPAAA